MTPPPPPPPTLQDHVRPVQGGLQIAGESSAFSICTLGFTGYGLDGQGNPSYRVGLTASHCFTTRGAADNTKVIGQPSTATGDIVG